MSVSTSREHSLQQCENKFLRSPDNDRLLNNLEYLAFAFIHFRASDVFTESPFSRLFNKYPTACPELHTMLGKGYLKNIRTGGEAAVLEA